MLTRPAGSFPSMSKPFFFIIGLVLGEWLAGFTAPFAHATNSYDYKPGETRVVDHGLSPDKQFSISAGNNAKGDFCLYLVDAKSKKRIGPLEEAVDQLDTDADAISAAWSPDSRHIILKYRIDHQESVVWVYRVENRRAFVVNGPTNLFLEVPGMKAFSAVEPYSIHRDASWVDATHFTFHHDGHYPRFPEKPTPALKAYISDVEAVEHSDDEKPDKRAAEIAFDFAADGTCELVAGDKYRVVSLRPAPAR